MLLMEVESPPQLFHFEQSKLIRTKNIANMMIVLPICLLKRDFDVLCSLKI